jgi:hypothetical protein
MTSGAMRLVGKSRGICFIMSQSDDNFSLGVSFLKIPESISELALPEASIHDRYYFAGFRKLFHKNI